MFSLVFFWYSQSTFPFSSNTIYRISANSFRGNYSFLNSTLCTVTFDHSTYRCGNYSRVETTRGNTVWILSNFWGVFSCFHGQKRYFFKNLFLPQNRLILQFSNLNVLNKGILMQDWVFRLGLRSYCSDIYTLTRRLVGESRFGKKEKKLVKVNGVTSFFKTSHLHPLLRWVVFLDYFHSYRFIQGVQTYY